MRVGPRTTTLEGLEIEHAEAEDGDGDAAWNRSTARSSTWWLAVRAERAGVSGVAALDEAPNGLSTWALDRAQERDRSRQVSEPERRDVAFLGGGRMGEALVSGLIRSGGRRAEEITVTARRPERVQ